MQKIINTFLSFILIQQFAFAQDNNNQGGLIPGDFVQQYYKAYSGVPKAERLAPFYDDSVMIDDPTYDWTGKSKNEIFKNFDANNLNNDYTWRIDQQIIQDNKLVTEGLLTAKYGGFPYEMRFVNIFHFDHGKIVKQYDYYDNKRWYEVVEEWKKKQQKN